MVRSLAFLTFVLFFQSFSTVLYSQCEGEADLYFKQASALATSADFEKAAQLFEKSAEIEKSCQHPRLVDLSLDLFNAATCYKYVGNTSKSISLYSQNLTVALSIGAYDDYARSIQELVDVHLKINNVEEALQLSKQLDSVTRRQKSGSLSMLSLAIQLHVFNHQSGSMSFENLMLEYNSIPEPPIADSLFIDNQALVFVLLAEAYRANKKTGTACMYFEKALANYSRINNVESKVFVQTSLAECYAREGKRQQAIQIFNEAAAIFEKLDEADNLASVLNSTGNLFVEEGNYAEAYRVFDRALMLYVGSANAEGQANTFVNIGNAQKSTGLYQQAVDNYNKALGIFFASGDVQSCSVVLNNLGNIYIQRGEFDNAITTFDTLLASPTIQSGSKMQSLVFNNIGGVYMSWGQYDKAMEYYQLAFDINKLQQDQQSIAMVLNNIGGVYQRTGKAQKALECFQQSIDIYNALGNKAFVPGLLNNIGNIYMQQGNYTKAIEMFNAAIAIADERGDLSKSASICDNLGSINALQKNTVEAEKYFVKALEIRRLLKEKSFITSSLNNLAVLYLETGKTSEAIDLLNESVQMLEELRKTAKGDTRKDFLAAQIQAYQNLIVAYVKVNQPDKCFYINELCKSKYLAEQLSGDVGYQIPDARQVESSIDAKTLVLCLSTTDNPSITNIIVTQKGLQANLYARDVLTNMLLENSEIKSHVISQLELDEISRLQQYFASGGDMKLDHFLSKKVFETSVKSYIRLLNSKVFSDVVKAREIARVYYAYFILPIESQLVDKSKIVIMPDGVLGQIPFETLIDGNGSYLVERFDISYIHSFSVSSLIDKRVYSDARQPLLAMGVFDYRTSDSLDVQPAYDVSLLKRQVYADISAGADISKYYRLLGYSKLNNLHSGRDEIARIAGLFDGAVVIPDSMATEDVLKSMSASGTLSRYRIIHMSTHGIIIPEIPELSTIVLNVQRPSVSEDQYLRAPEISLLKCEADFINLSACETGIGKIYSGEGMVGLSQSCILAGANSISVSLWQVDEESTTEFMTRFYSLLKKNSYDYKVTMNQVKRDFIKGDVGVAWSMPYFWAPFVYFGKL